LNCQRSGKGNTVIATAVRSVLKFLIGAGLFVGLPIVGWGVLDTEGFFGHPVRVTYAVLVIILNAATVIAFPNMGREGGEAKKRVERQKWAILMLQVLSLSIVLVGPFCDRRGIAVVGGCDIARYVGLGTYLVGFTVMVWAEAYLGRLFSLEVSIQHGHKLVTDGIYRYLRHPRYLGVTLFSVGLSLVFRSWISLVLAVVTLAVLIWRMRDEETLMHQEFGADWEAYAKKTWRLIPFIY
jgi:protein-S-isoprenylcysteine O-methyltransferase Ste14